MFAGSTYVTPSLGTQVLHAKTLGLQELTPKQLEVLRLVGAGLRSRQIAERLGLSVRTVEAHKYTIMCFSRIEGGHGKDRD